MRVAVVHSFYRSSEPSGENAAVLAQVEALNRAGHTADLIAARTDDLVAARLYSLRASLTVATGFGRSPLEEIQTFEPDLVHAHNLFPNFGRRWVSQLTVPLVLTLHNFRPVCAAGTLFRAGVTCELCIDKNALSGVRHGCYRGSRIRTAPLALGALRGVRHDPMLTRAQKIIVLSERAKRIYANAGVQAEKLIQIPNFASKRPLSRQTSRDAAWLYAGRLTPEKGIDTLVECWPQGVLLRIAGDGPLADRLQALVRGKKIELLGPLRQAELSSLMGTSFGLVFPSKWYEGFPMIYAEAMAHGLPVLAFDPSSVADLVRTDHTGIVGQWGQDIARQIEAANAVFDRLRSNCETAFERKYSESVVVGRLLTLYESLTAKASAG